MHAGRHEPHGVAFPPGARPVCNKSLTCDVLERRSRYLATDPLRALVGYDPCVQEQDERYANPVHVDAAPDELGPLLDQVALTHEALVRPWLLLRVSCSNLRPPRPQ
jgi:hypothetical protein